MLIPSGREPNAHIAVAIPTFQNLQEITDASAFMTYGRFRSRPSPKRFSLRIRCYIVGRNDCEKSSFQRFSDQYCLQVPVLSYTLPARKAI